MNKRAGALALLLAASVAVSGCSTITKLNPFGKKDEDKTVASDGKRISIIAFDQKVEAAEGLKGVDFQLPTPAAQVDWTQPGGMPDATIENVDAAPAFEIAWRKGFGAGSNKKFHVTASPIVADGVIYVMDAKADVVAMDAKSGSVLWRRELHSADKRDKVGFGGGVAYENGKIYVTSGYRFVAQLDAKTGAVGWRQETESPIHNAPLVHHGKVYAISTDNEMLTYDAATGTPGWNYRALEESARILSASSPVAQGEVVVGGFASGEVVALRTANGNDLWANTLSKATRTNALSEIRDVAGRPVIYRGDLYAASHSGVFAAIDMRTGTPRWTLPIASVTTPWAAGDVVYITSLAGEVICVNRESGQVYWIKDLNEGIKKSKNRSFFEGPILAGDRLVMVSSDGRAIALNAKTGEIQKTIKLGGDGLITPIAVGGLVYVVTDKAELVAIR